MHIYSFGSTHMCVCATICSSFAVQKKKNNDNNPLSVLSVTQDGKGSGIVHRTSPSWENCSQPGVLYSFLKRLE